MKRLSITLAVLSVASLANAQTPQADPEYDLVVIGGTPGGVACAVRAARQGLRVLLINHNQHLGGFSSNGLGAADTQYDNSYTGGRAPLFAEWTKNVLDHYKKTYGENSPQYKAALPGPRDVSSDRLSYEPRVAEIAYDKLVNAEKMLTVLKGWHPVAVERSEREVKTIAIAPPGGGAARRISGRIFADATYEADLAALAGVPYRVGRESRGEYGEPHAGRLFTRTGFTAGDKGGYPFAATTGELNLRPFRAVTQEIFAGSTGEGDHKVQSYQIRLMLSRDPKNRRMPVRPPGYETMDFKYVVSRYGYSVGSGNGLPNGKVNWNRNAPGENYDYPDGNYARRQEILARHQNFAVGFLYFLQNDPSVPDADRKAAREWGLAKDEFTDNENIPYEMYVREARRIVGRYVFSEHDATLAPGLDRSPVHQDSIAIAEWFMDSHEVSTEKQSGTDAEGKLLLAEITRPSQIPYRSLLPKDLDNLLVPVPLSATHVAWGTIRLEPTWMHIGEAAGRAAALAIAQKVPPALISTERLQRDLVDHGVMISFFNDFDMKTDKAWVPAVQYLATKGLFTSYNAQADKPLTQGVARRWAAAFAALSAGRGESANERAKALQSAQVDSRPVTAEQFRQMLAMALALENGGSLKSAAASNQVITRGEACSMIYSLLQKTP